MPRVDSLQGEDKDVWTVRERVERNSGLGGRQMVAEKGRRLMQEGGARAKRRKKRWRTVKADTLFSTRRRRVVKGGVE